MKCSPRLNQVLSLQSSAGLRGWRPAIHLTHLESYRKVKIDAGRLPGVDRSWGLWLRLGIKKVQPNQRHGELEPLVQSDRPFVNPTRVKKEQVLSWHGKSWGVVRHLFFIFLFFFQIRKTLRFELFLVIKNITTKFNCTIFYWIQFYAHFCYNFYF